MVRIIRLIIILVVIGVGLLMALGSVMSYTHTYAMATIGVGRMLVDYVRANDGDLPESEEELIERGFLRKTECPAGCEYEYRYDRGEDRLWITIHRFEEFSIAYGVTAGGIQKKNGRFYNRHTNEEIILYDAPPHWLYPSLGKYHWDELYEEMQQARRASLAPCGSAEPPNVSAN